MELTRLFGVAALLLSIAAGPATTPATKPADDGDTALPERVEGDAKTGGLAYHSTTGTLTLRDEKGKPRAAIFHVAYVVPPTDPAAPRPVTFVFNGGPGSSSIWLHMGSAGPRTFERDALGIPPRPPAKLTDNPGTWLPATDLVFIDPVGTGFSRPADGVEAKEFHSVATDVQSVGEFIRLWLTREGRWGSPVFIAGESYGTTRAAALSQHLADAHGIDVSGIVLISTVLQFQTIAPGGVNDQPYALFLPSYAATAHYHNRLAPEQQARPLRAVLDDAEKFAAGDYLTALAAGSTLDDARRTAVARQIAGFTGLTEKYVLDSDLRIRPYRFMKSVLPGKVVGRFDATVTGPDRDLVGERPDHDPSSTLYEGPYTSAFHQHLRDSLGYRTTLRYYTVGDVNWDWGPGGWRGYADTASDLASAMTFNPRLRVMVAAGYQDLATPYFAARHTLARLNIPAEARTRIVTHDYVGGHMMYHRPETLRALGDDIRAFIGGK